MKLGVQIPIVGWASAEITVPEEFHDCSDAELVILLEEGKIELDKFMVEETYPVRHLRANADFGLNTEVGIER